MPKLMVRELGRSGRLARCRYRALVGSCPRLLVLSESSPAQLMVGARLVVAVVVLDVDIEGLLVVRPGLLVLSEFLRHDAQLMVGARLAVAVVVLDVDIESLLVVRPSLLVLSEFLCDDSQLMVGARLAVAVVVLDVDIEGLLVVRRACSYSLSSCATVPN